MKHTQAELQAIITIRDSEKAITDLIQGRIDIYNKTNGVAFKNIDACAKYTTVNTYTHYQFCVDAINWTVSVWEYARQAQLDVMAGSRAMPTVDELIAELPAYTGVTNV